MIMRLAVTPGRLFFCLLAVTGALSMTESKADESKGEERPVVGSMEGEDPGEVRDDNGLNMKLVWCPPGVVTMEMERVELVDVAPPRAAAVRPPKDDYVVDDVPQVEPVLMRQMIIMRTQTTSVTPVKAFLTKGYWLGRYEVTQSEWKRVMKTEPWKNKETTKEGDDFPATSLDWNNAVDFCRTLTQLEREAGRLPADWEYALPTEAQWERACRARTTSRFSFGDDDSQIGEYAWVVENTVSAGEDYAHQVGQKKPNPWGLYDMHGNVWEWCRDTYADKLPGGRDPVATKPGSDRILRGGGLYRSAPACRSSFRNQHATDWNCNDLGLRVALVQSMPQKKTKTIER